jgi:hypothetical protein
VVVVVVVVVVNKDGTMKSSEYKLNNVTFYRYADRSGRAV